MKKLLLSILLCICAITASAQFKSIDVKANLRGEVGLGVGATIGLAEKIDIAPSLNYYFVDFGNCYTVDADFHYNIGLGKCVEIYPLAGPVWFHYDFDGFDGIGGDFKYDKLGANLGCGIRLNTSKHLSIFGEGKYQFVFDQDGESDSFFSLGLSYRF